MRPHTTSARPLRANAVDPTKERILSGKITSARNEYPPSNVRTIPSIPGSQCSMTARRYFDIGLIVPLEEELEQVTSVFPHRTNYSTTRTYRYELQTDNPNISLICILQNSMGRNAAMQATQELLADFEIGTIVCLGIAGGISGDLDLGDISYTGTIIDVYDNSKISDNDQNGIDLHFSPVVYQTPREITAALGFIRTFPEIRNLYEEWRQQCAESAAEILKLDRGNGISLPKAKDGAIVCGAVSQSEQYNQRLVNIDRKLLAIETEAGGVFSITQQFGVPALIIRGISDLANSDKSMLELKNKGAYRRIAAQNAARFLRMQMINPYFVQTLGLRRNDRQLSLSVPVGPLLTTSATTLVQSITELANEIHLRLRELSPEYRLQERGYKLPAPRVRMLVFNRSISDEDTEAPQEVRDAIQNRIVTILHLPRTYPDPSLPWVIADDLLTAQIAGRQPIPILIDGEDVRPPNGTLASQITDAAKKELDNENAVPIFILNDIPLLSRTKMAFLESQMALYPKARFIIIIKDGINLLAQSDFATRIGADVFQIAGASFGTIVHFLQKNFAMPYSEAEVVALRLQNTFDQFQLSAHPTYFAGIPKEVLSALLQANRRAELIQLAVDGFLTFLVADDSADVTLSRTTRSRFLRELALRIHVDKEEIDETLLISIVKDFARRYDFAINPIDFIGSFVNKGILHFESDRVHFSLPFMETYLLALELSRRPDIAESYFDFSSDDFDLQTFDLYTEIGASDKVVASVVSLLAERERSLELTKIQPHVLLSGSVHPAGLSRPERLRALEKRLKQAVENVSSGNGEAAEKQKILDVYHQVRDAAAKQSTRITLSAPDSIGIDVGGLSNSVKDWTISLVMLGSGAEYLSADLKLQIASRLLTIGSAIIHFWTSLSSSINFREIETELRRSLDEIENEDSELKVELDQSLSRLIEILELTILAEPFRRVIHQLCECGGHKVLATSVSKVAGHSVMDRLIHAIWLAELEPKNGIQALKKIFRDLPPAVFLRVMMATHLLTRVYWNHWKRDDRLALLDAAAESLRAVNFDVNKAELKRMIERDSSV